MANAELTPNVVVQNPQIRNVAQWVIGLAALFLPTLAIIDANTALDFSAWLPATVQVTSLLAGAFGLTVVVPNIPSEKRDQKIVDLADAEVLDEGTYEIITDEDEEAETVDVVEEYDPRHG